MPILKLQNISKTFGKDVTALSAIDMQVEKGEVIALLGESGSGKTTLLRIIAGFEVGDSGSIWLSDEVIADDKKFVQPEKRGIGMVFQDYALFPHLNVISNVMFGLSGSKQEQAKTAESFLDLVGLSGFEKRFPHELSGGQQQRVAIARALAPEPKLILLDEPFSNLDESLKGKVRQDIKQILKQTNSTAIFVTHDTKDALAVADRVIVLQNGKQQQFDTPSVVYNKPASTAVATLFGHHNIFDAEAGNGELQTSWGSISDLSGATSKVKIMIPESAIVLEPAGKFSGTVKACQFMGSTFQITIGIGDSELIASSSHNVNVDSAINFNLDAIKILVWP